MNLPNALTVGRIAATPLVAVLPFANSWTLRLMAFALFLAAAITDYIDGHLARSRAQETDLGRLLDPLADKLLLVATLYPVRTNMGTRVATSNSLSARGSRRRPRAVSCARDRARWPSM